MKFILLLALLAATGVFCNSRITTNSPEVMKCYQNTTLNDRYRRSPMSLQHFIYIIRKIENHPEVSNWDMQAILAGIINRYKIDGMYSKAKDGTYYEPEPYVDVLESAKRTLLNEMGYDDRELPNNILTGEEACALHWMISHSVNYTRREEEDHYLWRKKREIPIAKLPDREKRQIKEDQKSTYPLEMGVIQTKWGTISGGTVLMGLFFGLMEQSVSLKNLVMNIDLLPEYLYNTQIMNYWAATLAGDLGQTAVLQGHKLDSYSTTVEIIGPKGEWNSTYCPREFKLRNNDTGLTACEVYGGIDGILMALEINDWDSSSRRLSHLLEMYYSEDGVLYDRKYRACDRMDNFKAMVDRQQLEVEATGFAYAYMLYPGVASAAEMPLLAFNNTGYYVTRATDSLYSYINNVDYPNCDYDPMDPQEEMPADEDLSYNNFADLNVATSHDLYIVLDKDFSSDREIQEVKTMLAYLTNKLQNGSRVALYYADGSNLQEIWKMDYETSTACSTCLFQGLDIRRGSGMDFETILEHLHRVFTEEEEMEVEANVRGSNSKVLLLVTPRTQFEDKTRVKEAFWDFLDDHAYLRYLVLGDKTWTEIFDDENVFTMSSNEETMAFTLYERMIEWPARLLDPMCDNWDYSENRNKDYHTVYLTPNTVQYWDLNSIYFHAAERFLIKIKGDDGYVAVCVSRNNVLPNIENSESSTRCYKTSSGERELSLAFEDACEDLDSDHHPRLCNNIYLSFEPLPDSSTSDKCDDMECTRPDQLQVEVFLEDTRCGACGLLASPLLWLLSAAALLLQKL